MKDIGENLGQSTEDQELRRSWRLLWLSSINELTDIDLQRATWLDMENLNPHWTYVEFMCSYFDDSHTENNYESPLKWGFLSEEEFTAIQRWHELLDAYEEPVEYYDHKGILEDEKWLQIAQLGLECKRELSKHLNEEEKEVLNEKVDYLKYMTYR